jgi:hypothetical protein
MLSIHFPSKASNRDLVAPIGEGQSECALLGFVVAAQLIPLTPSIFFTPALESHPAKHIFVTDRWNTLFGTN